MLGATVQGNQTEFRVWAPKAQRATLRLLLLDRSKQDLAMERADGGEFRQTAKASAGDKYFYLLDDGPQEIPDPVSRLLPNGVHGATEIVDPARFQWSDENWRGISYRDYVIYELHIGTFTPEGTFHAAIEKLDYLKQLGVTAIEIMPVAAFPGKRNWGYDGVSMYAVQESYGGPEGMKQFVDAAHARGLAVVLDVVYNHLGNEGNYLAKFGPYFTHKHTTPWGDAINFDDADCRHVRDYVIENALYWAREYHIDGLRMDAVHAIKDDSPTHVIAELRDRVQQFAGDVGREITLVAESDENSPRYVRPRDRAGYGLNGVWSDDFHHAAHALFTGEREGYYQDFGSPEQLVRAINEGFAFQGEMFNFWKRPRGEKAGDVPLVTHVICIQNHDQVGNRALGERLTALVPRGVRKLLATLLLLAPETPLLWMGQEYDEEHPFQFFTDYGDPVLQKAVSEGRRNEFKHFKSFGADFPDPQDPATFERSRLNWQHTPEQQDILNWYRKLLCLRRNSYSEVERRTARARVTGEQSIEVQIPAESPQIVVRARWGGDYRRSSDGNVLISSDEDGVLIEIVAKAQHADRFKRLC
ncbi:MAG TPA: malto-oligosyltrehalose trehalohydrolase [Terriglobales bacterium]|nr:malto-oligosyltrehalose trehalohydrolase [Terriglobales bacterium]